MEKRTWFFCAVFFICIALTACGKKTPARGNRQDTTALDLDAVTTENIKLPSASTGEEYTAGADTGAVIDTTDYSQFYDNSPNTAEPRAYTEDEIEVDITEDKYVSYVNDIYVYTEDYLGKMIRIEGIYLGETFEGKNYQYIYRRGPGCCDTDGEMCGFEFTYNGELPKNGDWIEVVGTLRQYLDGNLAYLTLDAVSVTVKQTRGAEEVTE